MFPGDFPSASALACASADTRLRAGVRAVRASDWPPAVGPAPERAKTFGRNGQLVDAGRRVTLGITAQGESQQIQAAGETARSGGDEPLAAFFEAQVNRAKAIRGRLKRR
jgi:hypothetical protein